MTKKKKQHLIPECYLKSFTDPEPPQGVPKSKYHPAVWVNEKSLKSEPSRKAPKNLLWKSYFYNLKDDNPEQPYIEEFLSKIESDFTNLLNKIENEKVFSAKELFTLAVFIDTLFRRTENQINYWEDKLDEIKNLYRQVNETYAERNEESREVAKRLIVEASGTIAKLVLQEGFNIVVNNSDVPFFTSDHPVSYSFMHIDDLHSHSIPENWTYKGIGTNERNFFCFCPLTTKHAFISSPFLKSKDEVPFYRK